MSTISISNNTRKMYAFHYEQGAMRDKVMLLPGLNLGINRDVGENIRQNPVFKTLEEQALLTYVDSDKESTLDAAKEKHGNKVIDNEAGEITRITTQDELKPGKKAPYMPTMDLLVEIDGVGKATARKIIEEGEARGGWKNYSDMVQDLEPKFPSAEFTKDNKVSQ